MSKVNCVWFQDGYTFQYFSNSRMILVFKGDKICMVMDRKNLIEICEWFCNLDFD